MKQAVPVAIVNATNIPVLDYIKDMSAHSDVGEVLLKAVKPLGDVQTFCPDWAQCRYVVVSAKGVIFAFAIGMNTIALRLNPPLNTRALTTGGAPVPELGDAWVKFILFRDDWPEFDLTFWARKAYVYARETVGTSK
jgi:hypothetical protein